jgi:hypothetical protein
MQLVVEDQKKDPTENIFYKKFVMLSESIGNFIYNEKDLSKLKNINIKKKSHVTKKVADVSMPEVINISIQHEKEIRRVAGMGVLSIIILSIILVIIYILNYIISTLFDMMAWWLVAIIAVAFTVPLFLSIVYLFAVGDY